MTDERRFTVRWQRGTYHGNVVVHAIDQEHAVAKARQQLRRDGALCLPMAYEHFEAIEQ